MPFFVIAAGSDAPSAVPYLGFVTALIWQSLIAGSIVYYRQEIRELINGLSKLELPGVKVERTQLESKNAPSLTKEVMEEFGHVARGSFLSRDQIKKLVNHSGLVDRDEQALEELQILSNSHQRGWLVATNRRIFYLLDTKRTRSKGTVIQWRLFFEEAKPVKISEPGAVVGNVSFGKRKRNWLYSVRLYSDPDRLREEILNLMEKAEGSK